jgi:CRP-like cAMP-binding protein
LRLPHVPGSTVHPKHKLLEGLPAREQQLVLDSATIRRFAAGTIVTRQDAPADHVFVVLTGGVRFFYTSPDGRKFLLIWVAPGEAFGGAALLAKPNSYFMSCETVKESKILVWDRATLRGFAEKFPQIKDNALTIAAGYVEWYMVAHVALSCHSARERLARVLLNLSRAIGETVPEGIEIEISNEDLSNAANITHYTTSRLMSGWQRDRTILKRRGKIVLRSPENLILRAV